MSGHSKWSQIKRQKGANDVKRGATFTKMGREIAVAARQGGGDPDANFRLRLAIEKARAVNMPADTIKRAIERATGGGEAEQYEEIVYEGYGPGGVAVLVEAATDNRNRTAAEVRSIFTKAGGQLAGSGAVAWQFEPRGIITITRDGNDADEVALAAIDAGADDVDTETDPLEIYTAPTDIEAVRRAMESAGYRVDSAELDDDRQAARSSLTRRRRARTCASSSSSRTSTTCSASRRTSTFRKRCLPRLPVDAGSRGRPGNGGTGIRNHREVGRATARRRPRLRHHVADRLAARPACGDPRRARRPHRVALSPDRRPSSGSTSAGTPRRHSASARRAASSCSRRPSTGWPCARRPRTR